MTTSPAPAPAIAAFVPDSPAAWRRLLICLAIATLGCVGTWSVVVVLPQVAADLGATRGAASLAYTSAMIGFGLGGVVTGRLTDRLGIIPAMGTGIVSLLLGCLGAGVASLLWQFVTAYGFIGLGASATFAPLMAEASRWFVRRRGLAVGIAGSGYYLSGALWPSLIERGIAASGWRMTHIALGIFCAATMSLLVLLLRSSLGQPRQGAGAVESGASVDLDLSPNRLTVVLSVASFACCMAMAIPHVHLVAYCGDLGYGTARGVQMLSLMLALGVVSRIGSGFIADQVGGLATLLIGSVAQAAALAMYLFFNGLASLYLISAVYGLFQGGIVSSYAIIVRETMPAKEAATRVGTVIMVSLLGMSFGAWSAGAIFDGTGSYRVAFLNGLAWNALNALIVLLLLLRARRLLRRRNDSHH